MEVYNSGCSSGNATSSSSRSMVAWSPPTDDSRAVGGSRAEGVDELVVLTFLDEDGPEDEDEAPAGRGRRRTGAAAEAEEGEAAGEGACEVEGESCPSTGGGADELRFRRDLLLGHEDVRDLLSEFIEGW